MCSSNTGIKQLKQSNSRRWVIFDRKRNIYRVKYMPVFFKALNDSIKPFINVLSEITDFNVIDRVIEYNYSPVELEKAYARLYMDVAPEFARYDRGNVRKSAGIIYQTKNNEDEIFDDIITQEVRNYIATGAVGKNLKIIENTSKELLQKIVASVIIEINEQGLGVGKGITMLRDRAIDEFRKANRYRMERIVRTETTTASNWGSLKGVMSTGLPTIKGWSSALDESVRTDPFNHAISQVVKIHEAFTETGEPLQYPGDQENGSAGNIINCRCAQNYQVANY